MSLEAFKKRLEGLGCIVTLAGDVLNVDVDEHKISITFKKDWKRAVEEFYKAKQYKFDVERRVLTANRSAEFQLTRLDPCYFFRNKHKFEDKKGNTVFISPATKEFLLSYYQSEHYEVTFHQIKERIGRRCNLRRRKIRSEQRILFNPDELIVIFRTAQYVAKRKPRNTNIYDVAVDRVLACLFSLARVYKLCLKFSSFPCITSCTAICCAT